MIRDPSDGSVREIIIGPESGLRLSKADADRAERLERSREWLRDYLERRQPANQPVPEAAE